MKPKFKAIPIFIMTIILCGSVFLLGFSYKDIREPNEYYKVYVPNGVEIIKTLTYKKNTLNSEEVYNIIKEKEPFTIKGYIYVINAEEKETVEVEGTDYLDEVLSTVKSNTINVLEKDVFEKSIDTITRVFIGSEELDAYNSETQKAIEHYGSIIENVDYGEKITSQEGYISVEDKIYTDSAELSQFLLYGTLEKQDTYSVKDGDSIEKVAFNNNLSIDEFLVANPTFSSKDNLLFPGQEVNIGLIQPQISIVGEYHTVVQEEQKYNTIIEYDNSVIQGYGYEKKAGENGINDVTQKIQYVNGKITQVVPVETVVVKPTIDRIYVKGSKTVPNIGDLNDWGWAASCYTITSYYGPRWGRLHAGIDIAGCGYGSPIYAINNGTVTSTGYNSTMGYYIIINHNNGYKSVYMHLAKIYTQEGNTVSKGTKIGSMGSTGRSTGTHLHLGIYTGCEYCMNSNSLDPMLFY
jgi:murein DD-endopeptidase MepM/ murein hydrolase activator NlpD